MNVLIVAITPSPLSFVFFAVGCTNGSVCVNLQQMSVSCIPVQSVCNGYIDCPDNSDEANCPGELS